MNLLFVHDNPFYITGDKKVYATSQWGQYLWNRYPKVFRKVTVLARIRKVSKAFIKENNLVECSLDNLSFVDSYYNSFFNFIAENRKIKKRIKETLKEHDALIARLPSELGALSVIIAREIGKPYAIELVGCPLDSLRNIGSLKGKLYAPFSYMRTKKAVARSKYVLYVTEAFLQNRYPTKGINVGCSNVELQHTSYQYNSQSIDRRKRICLGVVGSFNTEYKNQELAIKALPLLKEKFNDIELQLVGEGSQDRLARLVKDMGLSQHVSFMGHLSREELISWFKAIHIYIQPSKTEGLPRAVLEAMSLGIPVVGTNVGGIPELVQPELLVTPENYAGLAEVIERLLVDADYRNKISKDNYKRSLSYSKENLDRIRTEFWELFKCKESCAKKIYTGE